MAGETQITVIGNLTADPELRVTPSGASVVNFTIASTPRTFDRESNSWKDGNALFLRCSIWREYAEHVVESLSKGMQVIAQGNLRIRAFEDKDGSRRTATELEVLEIGPTLRFATAKVERAQRSTSGGGGSNWANTGSQPHQNHQQQQQGQGGWNNQPPQNQQQGRPPQQQQGGGWNPPPSDPWNTGGNNAGWGNPGDEPPF